MITTYRRSTLNEQRKVYWAGRLSSNDLSRGPEFQRQLVIESILETQAATILEFFAGLRGTLSVTLEEGTWAAWLYDCMSRRRLMYSVGTDLPEEKSDLCSLDRIRGGNEANEVDQQSHPWDGERVIGL
jgi:hypothetical protein